MPLRNRLLALVAVLSALSAGLQAQAVAGTVIARDSAPVPGVVVVANNAQGTAVARTLTSARGEFTLRLPAAGRFSLRLLRVGYRPTAGPTVDVAAGATVQVRLVFLAEAITLAAVNVRERETCRVNADSGLIVARVWEQARTAMLTATTSVADAPLFAEWIEYDRALDSTARLVRAQRVRTSRNPTTHAFRSVPADVLAAEGYVVVRQGATTYYAPDADALLSDAFAEGHCFRLAAPPPDRPTSIGVAFQPTRDRREKLEITGTLWLDRASGELQTLEFRYTNLPDVVESVQAGGRVEFLRFGDGNWIVSRWHVRMPQMAAAERPATTGGRVVITPTAPTLQGIQLTGGEVVRVTRGSNVVYQAVGPWVAVQVLARDTLLGAATLRLDGTDYAGTADASGRLRVSPVLAGRYRAQLSTPLMDSLGMSPVVAEVETRTDTHVDSLALPLSRDALARACPRDSISHGEGMLHGRVRDDRARAIDAAAVVVTWQGASNSEKTIGTLTGANGYWRLCGVPRAATLAVRVVSDSGSDRRDVILAAEQPFAGVDLTAKREVAGSAAGNATSALVELSAFDLVGKPLPDATLEVHPSSGPTRTVVTGPGGRALLPDIAPGVLTIRAKRVGYKPGEVSATVEAGRNTVPVVLSTVSAPTLAAVRIVGNRTAGRHDEFDMRLKHHLATVSLTREDIEKRNPVDIWTMLTGIPSVNIVNRDNLVIAASTRSRASTLFNPVTGRDPRTGTIRYDTTNTKNAGMATKPCLLMVIVDGIVMNPNPDAEGFDLRQLPRPADIYGVEVFAGPESIPPQYGGMGAGKWCGMIAVWTR